MYKIKFDYADKVLSKYACYQRPDAGFYLWLNVGNGEKFTKALYRNYSLKVMPGIFLSKGKYKNPYGANYAGFGDEGVKEGGWGNERDLGYVLLNAGGDTGFFRISVSVCHQLPCTGDKWNNPGDNVIVAVYRWFP